MIVFFLALCCDEFVFADARVKCPQEGNWDPTLQKRYGGTDRGGSAPQEGRPQGPHCRSRGAFFNSHDESGECPSRGGVSNTPASVA